MKKQLAELFQAGGVTRLLLLTTALILAASGCSSGPPKVRPRPHEIQISGDSEAAALTIDVYVTAVNSMGEADYLTADVDELLKRASKNRDALDMKYFPLSKTNFTIRDDDPVWRFWTGQKNADYLVVIADLPPVLGGKANRRMKIPLDKRLWSYLGDKPIHLVISKDRVTLVDQPRP